MLKEKVYIIGEEPRNSGVFLQLLKDRFSHIEWFNGKEGVKECLALIPVQPGCEALSLVVLFVEQSYLEEVSGFFKTNPDPACVTLVALSSGKTRRLPDQTYIFDCIDIIDPGFDAPFFFSRLDAEIRNKNRISLLQFEVREFYEIGKSLSSEKDTIKLFEMIIQSSMSMTSSDAGTIYLVVDRETGNWSPIRENRYDDKLLKFIIAKNMSMDVDLEAETFPVVRESISGCTVMTGRSLRIDDAYRILPDAGYCHDKSFDSGSGYRTRSILSIPMKDHENHVMGVIQLINKKKSKYEKIDYTEKAFLENIIPYDYTDELIMNSLAGQAAVALENNLLYRDMQKLLQDYREQNNHLLFLSRKVLKAHEEERKRIAREIHDGPAQSASSMVMKLEVCKKLKQVGDYDRMAKELDKLGDGLRYTVKEIRTIIYGLKPSCLEDGLIKALENHIKIFEENTGIQVGFSVSGSDVKVEYYMVSTVYRMVQEALSNVYKHAGAQKAGVILNINDKDIFLKIADNGKGFDVGKVESERAKRLEGGFGLEGIRERAELVKGDVSIQSAPGKGTAVIIRIPMI